MSDQEATLKPCPFCGLKAGRIFHTGHSGCDNVCQVVCTACEACGPEATRIDSDGLSGEGWETTQAEAARLWNERKVRGEA